MSHANFMKKFQWEGIKLCAIFGGTRLFSRLSGRFKGRRVVYSDKGRKSLGMYPFCPDVVEQFSYGFLRFHPHGYGVVNITR